MNIGLSQYETLEYCFKHNIMVTAYSPLGNPGITGPMKVYLSKQEINSLILPEVIVLFH